MSFRLEVDDDVWIGLIDGVIDRLHFHYPISSLHYQLSHIIPYHHTHYSQKQLLDWYCTLSRASCSTTTTT